MDHRPGRKEQQFTGTAPMATLAQPKRFFQLARLRHAEKMEKESTRAATEAVLGKAVLSQFSAGKIELFLSYYGQVIARRM